MDSYTEIKKYKMLVESAVTQSMTETDYMDETDMEEGNEFESLLSHLFGTHSTTWV